MSTRGAARAAVTIMLATPLLLFAAVAAHADPLPASYSGATHGDVVALDVTAAGLTITAGLGESATAVESTANPRAHAESANLEAGAIGIPIAVASAAADATTNTPAGSYATGLAEVDVPPLLDTGVITGTGSATWPGDAACVPDGTPIAQSTTSLAAATLGIPGITIMNLGAVQTSGSTTLNAGSVVSASSGNLASLSLVNGLVDVSVLSQPTLTATSDGTTGTFTANAYAVSVTVGGVATTLTAGASLPVNLDIGLAAVSLTITVGQVVNSSAGATGSATMTFLSITGTVTQPLVGTLADINIGLLPLSASATGAPGGVQCSVLAPPVITSPTDGTTTGQTPTITGTGIPGATLTVTGNGGATLGTAVVAPDGTWSLLPSTPLAAGTQTITAAQALGPAASGPSAPVTFTVADLTPPAAPVITSPADGSTTNDNTPTITGTGEPGATLAVSIDGTVVGTTTVAPDGTWSAPTTTALADGSHTATATQTDAAGNTSPASTPVTFAVDTSAPAAPVITSPADGTATNTPTPTIAGTGEPGATVSVSIDGTVVGATTVAPDGTWALPTTTALADGSHTLTAAQSDPAGNASPASAPVTVTVDTTVSAPVITGPTEGSDTNDPTPTITGTGEPGAVVTVSIDGTDVGTTVVAPDGTWSLPLTGPLGDGPHTVAASQVDVARNASPDDVVTFEVDTTPPVAPVITSPADGSTTPDSTPTVTGTGESGDTVTMSVDGTEVGTTTVGPATAWNLPVTDPLGDGTHTITATETDPAGNTSPVTTVNLTVSAVATAEITSPAPGATLTDTTPTIVGTGEPGKQVQIAVDGRALASTTVGSDGTWSLTLTAPLSCGGHTITVTQDADPATVTVTIACAAAGSQLPATGIPGALVTVGLLGALATVVGAVLCWQAARTAAERTATRREPMRRIPDQPAY